MVFRGSSCRKYRKNNFKNLLNRGYEWVIKKLVGTTIEAVENVFRVQIALYLHERGQENLFASGLHNCRELSQPLGSLYQAVQIQGKSLLLLYKLTLPRKNPKLFDMALIKEKFLSVVKSCTWSLTRVISSCFAKKMLCKIQISLA